MKIKNRKTLLKMVIGVVGFALVILCILLILRGNHSGNEQIEDNAKGEQITEENDHGIELEDDIFENADSADASNEESEIKDDTPGNKENSHSKADEPKTDAVVLPEVPIP